MIYFDTQVETVSHTNQPEFRLDLTVARKYRPDGRSVVKTYEHPTYQSIGWDKFKRNLSTRFIVQPKASSRESRRIPLVAISGPNVGGPSNFTGTNTKTVYAEDHRHRVRFATGEDRAAAKRYYERTKASV